MSLPTELHPVTPSDVVARMDRDRQPAWQPLNGHCFSLLQTFTLGAKGFVHVLRGCRPTRPACRFPAFIFEAGKSLTNGPFGVQPTSLAVRKAQLCYYLPPCSDCGTIESIRSRSVLASSVQFRAPGSDASDSPVAAARSFQPRSTLPGGRRQRKARDKASGR